MAAITRLTGLGYAGGILAATVPSGCCSVQAAIGDTPTTWDVAISGLPTITVYWADTGGDDSYCMWFGTCTRTAVGANCYVDRCTLQRGQSAGWIKLILSDSVAGLTNATYHVLAADAIVHTLDLTTDQFLFDLSACGFPATATITPHDLLSCDTSAQMAKPTDVLAVANPSGEKIDLSWTLNDFTGGIHIYYSSTDGSSPFLEWHLLASLAPGTTSYQHASSPTPAAGTTYYYMVRMVDTISGSNLYSSWGNLTGYSNTGSAGATGVVASATATAVPPDPEPPYPGTPNPPFPIGRCKCCCPCNAQCGSFTPCYFSLTLDGTDYRLTQKGGYWLTTVTPFTLWGCTVDTISFHLDGTGGNEWILDTYDSTAPSSYTEWSKTVTGFPTDCTQPIVVTKGHECGSGAPSSVTLTPSATKRACCCPACAGGTPDRLKATISGVTGSPFTLNPLVFTGDAPGTVDQCTWQTTFAATSVGTGSGACGSVTTLRVTVRGGAWMKAELGDDNLATIVATWLYSNSSIDCNTSHTLTIDGSNACTLPSTITVEPLPDASVVVCNIPGCVSCNPGTEPDQFQVAVSGIVNRLALLCSGCASLNGTYVLDKIAECYYALDFSAVCGYTRIELLISPGAYFVAFSISPTSTGSLGYARLGLTFPRNCDAEASLVVGPQGFMGNCNHLSSTMTITAIP